MRTTLAIDNDVLAAAKALALIDPVHVNHDAAHGWFKQEGWR